MANDPASFRPIDLIRRCIFQWENNVPERKEYITDTVGFFDPFEKK